MASWFTSISATGVVAKSVLKKHIEHRRNLQTKISSAKQRPSRGFNVRRKAPRLDGNPQENKKPPRKATGVIVPIIQHIIGLQDRLKPTTFG